MKGIGKYLLIILLVLTGIWFYRKHQENERKKKEVEAERARQLELEKQRVLGYFKEKLRIINKANQEFANHVNIKTGYFTNYQLAVWKNQYSFYFDAIEDNRFENVGLSNDEIKSFKAFREFFINSEKLRYDFNQRFVREELKSYSSFFDNVEGRKLDNQQRVAIVTDETNNIVVAGAGSGKTTTIVGKVNYILDRYNARPEEILLISFTNKSATTLAERLNIEGVEAKTFHKFGKDVIVEVEGRQPSVFEEAQFKPLLKRFFNELSREEEFLQKVTDYFTNYLKPQKSQFDFNNQGDYIQYIKDQNFRSYKLREVPVNGRMTYRMEVVKSIEECKIANFLLFNGVKYDYEFPYEHDTATESYRQYKPDFTITQGDKKVYIEHFGISRNGDVPNWFSGDGIRSAREVYHSGIEWKRNQHKRNDTTLIETFSYEMKEDILFDNLTKKLQNVGIDLRPKSPEEIWQIISQAAKDEIAGFINLFGTFISLMKSNNYSISDVVARINQVKDKFTKERNTLFLEIIGPIFKLYENHLMEKNEIDFSDMINKASNHIANGRLGQKISYVIIDEFQDISIGRYQLVKAIKKSNPYCKLFCVGDDWQSIYRFSGSDIALFKEFESYFGFTIKSKIETTYRYKNPLLSLSSDFIMKNPNQASKELKATSSTQTTDYRIQYSTTDNQDDTFAIQKIFDELLNTKEYYEEKETMILGRYGFDINRLSSKNGLWIIVREFEKNSENIVREYAYTEDKWNHLKENEKIIVTYKRKVSGKELEIEAEYLTVHKAKGLEADNVIILNCNSGKFGFPSEMSDDQVLNLILSEADQFENGEERRLFYVAMTRAKERVYFVADSSYKSKFITELEVESGESPNKKCPKCITSDMVLKRSTIAVNGNTRNFYGCTNYLYGCDYTSVEWINRTIVNS